MAIEVKHGRRAEDICEGGAGGEYHRAILLSDLGSTVEAVEAEFAYDIDEPASDLLRLVRDLKVHLERLSITTEAELVLDRTCGACGGSGHHWKLGQGDACDECGGTGVALREQRASEEA
jgi:hypothetical protein